ncbi:MAG: hypothetical protein D3923_18055 [Candidatus Electrothrix sp. AR3]|nr:hypothetical protein [Candidatus Electrothrix sp. AR3]
MFRFQMLPKKCQLGYEACQTLNHKFSGLEVLLMSDREDSARWEGNDILGCYKTKKRAVRIELPFLQGSIQEG